MRDEEEIKSKLHELRLAVDDILYEAHRTRNKFSYSCINWGNLSCVETFYIINEQGNENWQVCIEGAAPQNSKFHHYVLDKLAARLNCSINNFIIRTEW